MATRVSLRLVAALQVGRAARSRRSGLVWNSMMSMAGGWFFLMISEAFRLGDRDFRLPGIGSYMSVAVRARATAARCSRPSWPWSLMIVVLDQLLWRPVVVWAQKFRVEEGGQPEAGVAPGSYDCLRRSPADPPCSRARQRPRAHASAPMARPRAVRPAARPRRSPAALRSSSLLLALAWLGRAAGSSHLLRDGAPRRVGATGRDAATRSARVLARPALAAPSGPSRPARDRPVAAPVARPAAGRPGRGVVPGADAVPVVDRWLLPRGGRLARLGQHPAHAAGHAVVHPVQRHRRRHGNPRGPARGGAASTGSGAGSASGAATCRPFFRTW